MQPGGEAWRGFGRKIFFGFVFMFVFFAFALWLLVRVITSVVASPSSLVLVPVILFLLIAIPIRTWRPIRRLISAAGRLADGDYSARVTPTGASSSRRVMNSFNEMARRLEDADEQRRRLLADLGHELRTPLTVIRGEMEAIVDGVHDADPEHMEILLEEVAVMERLLEDLRTLSMAEAGSLALHPESTDLVTLVKEAVESHRRTAEAQAVAIIVDGAIDVREVLVDPVRIREVVSNLVVNSLRAMPEGGALKIRVQVEAKEAVIRVVDTGVGIAADDLEPVFERFHKGSSSAGSGLGLTISRDLVEAHGGSISISSDVGLGTTVEMRLPLIRT
jgi:two-component system sensor histidine kinase BaeS